MWGFLIFGAGLAFLSAGCQDSRVTSLEQRVNQLEERTRQLEAERKKVSEDDAAIRVRLVACIAEADADFQSNMERNGTKARNGTYNVPVPLLAEMQKQKQGKIEECRILYSK
jgi:hypothetical protein